MNTFVHLHNRSDYSLLRGMTTVNELVGRVAELGMTAVALTDEDVLSGGLHFHSQCTGTLAVTGDPITPIIGCDMSVDLTGIAPSESLTKPAASGRIVLIALNYDGVRQLISLSSQSCCRSREQPVPLSRDLLEKLADNLLLLTGGIGGVLAHGQTIQTRHAILEWAKSVYGEDRVFIELVRDGASGQDLAGSELLHLAETHELGIVATNDTFYPTAGDSFAHEVMERMRESRRHDDAGQPRLPSEELYIKSAAEMGQLFSDVPEAIENTVRIASMVDPDLALPGPMFPRPELPSEFSDSGDYLRQIVFDGLWQRYDVIAPKIRERAEHELQQIIANNHVDAFVMYRDVVAFARSQGIRVGPGRAAAPGSIVAYALGITGVDPIRHGLVFERFLNPELAPAPDIDLDVSFDRREEVAEYLRQAYGPDRVAHIVTFGVLKPWSAIRRVADCIGLSSDDAERVASLVPRKIGITLSKAKERSPELEHLSRADPKHQSLFNVAAGLEGRLCCASTHAAGFAVADEPIRQRVPSFGLPGESLPVTQYSSEFLERAGAARVDLLGLRDLAVISRAEELVRRIDSSFAAANIPADDSATYRLLASGRSLGVFQFESSGIQKLLTRMEPHNLQDLCALNCLFRPEPFDLVESFLASRSSGRADPDSLGPIEPFLRETRGFLLYDEQLIHIAAHVGDISLSAADTMRRALRHGTSHEVDHWSTEFTSAASARGYERTVAETIFELFRNASPRLVLKAHVVAYTTIAYQTAYLKANHTPEFFAALFESHMGNPDRLSAYLDDARRFGVGVRCAKPLDQARGVELYDDYIELR